MMATTTAVIPVAAPVVPMIVTPTVLNDFSIRLTDTLARNDSSNLFISPLSISTILSILMLGARNESFNQLTRGLGFSGVDLQDEANGIEIHKQFQQLLQDEGLAEELLLSNLLYSNRPSKMDAQVIMDMNGTDITNGTEITNTTDISSDTSVNNVTLRFQELAKKYYDARLEQADFATDGTKVMNDVNLWVNESTRGLIDSILQSPPDASGRLLLLNAIYFKDKWAKPFAKQLTKNGTFWNHGTDNVTATFMTAFERDVRHIYANVSGHEVSVVELPYDGSNKSMVILLPKNLTGLSDIMSSESLVPDVSRAVADVSKAHEYPVNLEIPKFRLESEYNLNQHLIKLGISDIFTPGVADLSGIDGSNDLYVSLLKHKAVVNVNEEGTEAAAVTSVEVKVLSFNPPINFNADHPFLFIIKDTRTGLILFMGKVEHF